MFEDAFVVGDPDAVARLFEDGGVLATASETRSGAAIGPFAAALWAREVGFLANPRRVLQAHDTALVVSERSVSVLRRAGDGVWRYAISLLDGPRDDPRGAPMSVATTVRTGEGEARWWFAALAEIKATAQDTDGQLTIVEVTEPPGAQAPLHVHHREDEGFWILDGDVTFEVGDETIHANAGDFAWGPRDVPHRYTVGPDGCRMLFLLTPAGFESLVRDMSAPAADRTLPPSSDEEPDMERVATVAQAYGCELLG